MIIHILYKISSILRKPLFWGVFCLASALAIFGNKDFITSLNSDFEAQAKAQLDDLRSYDPKAAAVLSRIDDEQAIQALKIAANSAAADGHNRSTLAKMAQEMITTNGLPYRARLAQIAAFDPKLQSSEDREALLEAHATACEILEITMDHQAVSEYMTLLEQARQSPDIWEMVWDDPLALQIWAQDATLTSLQFYHRNRDWLGDHLAMVDYSETEGGMKLSNLLEKLATHEEILKISVLEGELGIYALARIYTHGGLIETCYKQFGLDPTIVVSIIEMNPDILLENEKGQNWIEDTAARLAQIHNDYSAVWFSASEIPFALRLHRDAPQSANNLFENYGGDMIPTLIYSQFENPLEVSAAAQAIDVFGDLAFYVFSRYEDPYFMNQLKHYLIDGEIGIRVIPFVVRFGDDAFEKIQDDPGWVDRYFEKNGTPRDDQSWIENIPLVGGPTNVALNWSKGNPCSWEELGWAAFDSADIALMLVSFGTSKTVTTAVKAGAKGASKKAVSKSVTRATSKNKWLEYLNGAAKGKLKSSPRLRKAAQAINKTAKITVIGPIRVANQSAKNIFRAGTDGLNKWKVLSPRTKRYVYRGLLGATVFITLTNRTLPNADKIGAGIGAFFADMIMGVTTAAGTAIAAAINEFLAEIVNDASQEIINDWGYRLALLFTILGAVFCFTRSFKNRERTVMHP